MATAPLFRGARLPLILQTEVAECGLACLAMVASYLGFRTDLATLRGRFSVSLNGTSMLTLTEYAERLRLSSRPLSLTLAGDGWWPGCHRRRPGRRWTGQLRRVRTA